MEGQAKETDRLGGFPRVQKGAPTKNILLSQGRELSHASKFVEMLHFPFFLLQNMNVYWSYPAPIIGRARRRERWFAFLVHSVSWGFGAHCFAGCYGTNVSVPPKRMATHSHILAWRIPWIEKPGGLQSQRAGYDWKTNKTTIKFICWNPNP